MNHTLHNGQVCASLLGGWRLVRCDRCSGRSNGARHVAVLELVVQVSKRHTSRRKHWMPCAVAFVKWHAKRSMLRGWMRHANRMNTILRQRDTHEYRQSVGVIDAEIIDSSLRRSEMAAIGSPQFATGPQKCVDSSADTHEKVFARSGRAQPRGERRCHDVQVVGYLTNTNSIHADTE